MVVARSRCKTGPFALDQFEPFERSAAAAVAVAAAAAAVAAAVAVAQHFEEKLFASLLSQSGLASWSALVVLFAVRVAG